MSSSQLTFIFFRGVAQPPTSFNLQEEEEEEEDVVDPAFMDWAKHWAENPTVQSAVLERKLKAQGVQRRCGQDFISKRGNWSKLKSQGSEKMSPMMNHPFVYLSL